MKLKYEKDGKNLADIGPTLIIVPLPLELWMISAQDLSNLEAKANTRFTKSAKRRGNNPNTATPGSQ